MLRPELLSDRAAARDVIRLAGLGLRAVLLDIEGTTTPIAFVHDVLFPFARARLPEYLTVHAGSADVAEVGRRLAAEHAADVARGEQPPPLVTREGTASPASLAAYASSLMDLDRKSPGLKLLQGLIWEDGYRAGYLRGQVFADVSGAIRRWHGAGIDVAIYSSGSELAQRLLFQSTEHGDLAPLIKAFFDTAVGAKIESPSYARIASALGRKPAEILFVSDVATELTAAREAGLAVVLSIRPGNPEQADAERFENITSLDQIE
jgi:enolase-phosphatase E1